MRWMTIIAYEIGQTIPLYLFYAFIDWAAFSRMNADPVVRKVGAAIASYLFLSLWIAFTSDLVDTMLDYLVPGLIVVGWAYWRGGRIAAGEAETEKTWR